MGSMHVGLNAFKRVVLGRWDLLQSGSMNDHINTLKSS